MSRIFPAVLHGVPLVYVLEFRSSQPKGSDASASNSAWELHDEKSICALVNEKQVDVMG